MSEFKELSIQRSVTSKQGSEDIDTSLEDHVEEEQHQYCTEDKGGGHQCVHQEDCSIPSGTGKYIPAQTSQDIKWEWVQNTKCQTPNFQNT